MLETRVSHTVVFGPNQFACMKGRGARDALAFLVMSWILQRKKEQSQTTIRLQKTTKACPRQQKMKRVRTMLTMGMVPALLCSGKALGITSTERLSLRRKMSDAAAKALAVSLCLFREMSDLKIQAALV